MFTFSIEIFASENHGMALVFYILLIEPSERFWTQIMIRKVFYVMFFFLEIRRSWEFCGCGVKIFLIGREGMKDW